MAILKINKISISTIPQDKIILVIIGLLLFFSYSSSLSQNIETLYESYLDEISQVTNNSPGHDLIEELISSPLELRTASAEEIARIPGISQDNAERIIDLISLYPNINLKALEDSINLGIEQRKIFELVTVLQNPSEFQRTKRFTWRARTKTKYGSLYDSQAEKFKGSPLAFYQRFNFQINNFSASILTDKKTGEVPLADFYSGFLEYKNDNMKFIIGDFSVQAGMGNILWKSFGARKSSEVISPAIQQGCGLSGYKSSLDLNFFRGIATHFTTGFNNSMNLKLIGWISKQKIGAAIDTSTSTISSIYSSGYYRTESEMQRKNTAGFSSAGCNAELAISNFKIGAAALYLNYTLPVKSSSSMAFPGKEGLLTTLYSYYDFGNLSLGGEFSRDAKGNTGAKFGIRYEGIKYDAAIAFRTFEGNFRSPFGYNFGESSVAANETGIYAALRWKPTTLFNLSIYSDFYSTPERTFSIPAKLHGSEIFMECLYIPETNLLVTMRIRQEYKTDKITTKDSPILYQASKTSARLEFKQNLNSDLFLRFRIEGMNADFGNFKKSEIGAMCFAECGYRTFQWLELSGRISYFSAPSYDSGIWLCELALPGYTTTVNLFGEGMRYSFSLKSTISELCSVHLRFSSTLKRGLPDEILDNTDLFENEQSMLYLMMELKF
ncbi:MAG: hypothetical protein HW421_1409 [Ignavibacteria bacterium]|nr:hypothetical protein [Ignavibacteria bacterium]